MLYASHFYKVEPCQEIVLSGEDIEARVIIEAGRHEFFFLHRASEQALPFVRLVSENVFDFTWIL